MRRFRASLNDALAPWLRPLTDGARGSAPRAALRSWFSAAESRGIIGECAGEVQNEVVTAAS